ncbi:MAG TPA: 50S ribosomal protein L3 N(5)-glutamine methyltransferase, partial [Gammaproteobacteria bacterium]|nr:50S ribosomal protein L3 N(5)-glutamine methyltransferase [Gammaproteobacteria bacterium]
EVGNTWGQLDREVTACTGEPIQWLKFEHGGHGICVLSKQELNTLYSAF